MKLNDTTIKALEERGFNRWTKEGRRGTMDRLYVNAGTLGLDCDYYRTGNICGAEFRGERISNRQAYRYKAAKTYIDVETGRVHSDYPDLEEAAGEILREVLGVGEDDEIA